MGYKVFYSWYEVELYVTSACNESRNLVFASKYFESLSTIHSYNTEFKEITVRYLHLQDSIHRARMVILFIYGLRWFKLTIKQPNKNIIAIFDKKRNTTSNYIFT